jgi:hypothetical protein
VHAAPVIDGVFSSSDNWGASVATITEDNGGNALPVSVYWQADSQYVYAAFVADTSSAGWTARPGTFANVYVYSSAAVGGTLGDGNDVIVQTTSDWLTGDSNLSNPVANITDVPVPAGTALAVNDRDSFTQSGDVYTSDGLITVGWTGGNTNVIEVKIDKSVLDYNAASPYTNLRVGIQGWSYDLSPAWPTLPATTVVPLPASAWSGGALLAALGAVQGFRRFRKPAVA